MSSFFGRGRGSKSGASGQKRPRQGASSSTPPLPSFASPTIHVDVPGVPDDIDADTIERMFDVVQPPPSVQPPTGVHDVDSEQPYEDHLDDLFGSTPTDEQPQGPQQPTQPVRVVGGGKVKTRDSVMFDRHYTKAPNEKKGGDPYFLAICNYCPANSKTKYQFKKGDGYGTLTRHLKNVHPTVMGIDTAQTQFPSSSGASASATQGAGTPSSLFHYSHENHRRHLAEFVSASSLPYSFGDSDLYENFAQMALNPSANRVPRTTLTRDIRKIVSEKKLILKENFKSLNHRVSICADIWSDHWINNFYLGITCHWVDDSWTLQKRLIGYVAFHERHTASNIARLISKILDKYSIGKKVFSISFDNATANTASIRELNDVCTPICGGRFFHIRCICHVLNLCVQAGYHAFKDSVTPIREAVNYLHKRPQEMKAWGRFCKSVGIKPKKFQPDVPTRWNSTFKMLNVTAEYAEHLQDFFNDPNRRDCDVRLSANDWANCSQLTNFLETFQNATNILSGVYYPTAQLVVSQCIAIMWGFKDIYDLEPFKYSGLVEDMLQKWLKYYYYIPDTFLIACLLDPTVREQGLLNQLNMYYDYMYQLPLPSGFPTYRDKPNIPQLVEQAKNSLYDMFRETAIAHGESPTTFVRSSGASSSGSSSSYGGQSGNTNYGNFKVFWDSLNPYKNLGGQRVQGTGYYELDHYLTSNLAVTIARPPQPPLNFDVLDWWSRMEGIFPIPCIMAKEIFAVPASTVAVEQAFSEGGYMLDPRRSRMTPDNLQAQMLLSDWKKAERRMQTAMLTSNEEEDDNDDASDFTSSTSGTGGDVEDEYEY